MSPPENAVTNELGVYFFPIDIDYEVTNDQTIIKLFGVTQDRKRIVVLDNFSPHLYVVPTPNTDLEALKNQIKISDFEITKSKIFKVRGLNLEKKIFNGNSITCIKVIVGNSDELQAVRAKLAKADNVQSIEEYDMRLYRRYLIGKRICPLSLCKVTGEVIGKAEPHVDLIVNAKKISLGNTDLIDNLKVLAIDIETLCGGAFPDPKKDSVITVALSGENFQKVITWKRYKDASNHVTFVDGELELLTELNRTIKQFRPDIMVGYGSDNFDFPFLKERASKYNISFDFGFDDVDLQIGKAGRPYAKITGLPLLDISNFIRNILDLRTDRYKLDNVARELLGKGKLFTPAYPKKINEMWSVGLEEDLRNLSEYNLTDARLAFELFQKIKPIQLELVKLIGLPIFDINRMAYGQLVENYLIKNATQTEHIVAKLPPFDEVKKRRETTFLGGFVIEPVTGLHKNLHVLDFRSLYPTIIVSHNISPETMNCECCKLRDGFKTDNVWFCSKQKGFFSEIVQDLIERRQRIKAILAKTPDTDPSYQELEARQYILKIIASSLFSYLSYSGSRWYNLDCAKAITSIGRKYIHMVIGEAEKFGFSIIYGDTDSLFMHKKHSAERAEIKTFLDIINSVLPKPIELEYRDFYPASLFIGKKSGETGAKKRYALLTTSGNIILKGIEAVRGDWSELAKKVQKKVIETILLDKGIDAAAKYVREQMENVKNRKVDISDLIIETRLAKPIEDYAVRSPLVAAAELAKANGVDMRAGSTIRYVVNSGEGKISDKVALAENASAKDYDVEYYSCNQILRSVSKIFEIFNYPEEKLAAGQTTLGSFE